jgi:hypothetical protein
MTPWRLKNGGFRVLLFGRVRCYPEHSGLFFAHDPSPGSRDPFCRVIKAAKGIKPLPSVCDYFKPSGEPAGAETASAPGSWGRAGEDRTAFAAPGGSSGRP